MLIIGHRGAAGYAPENTLASFRKALELRVDSIELDVRICKTGEVVVIHDDTVDRTTNGSGVVRKMSFIELRSLDAGNGEKIPVLSEVLDLVEKRVTVSIELKEEGNVQSVCDIIERYIKKRGWSHRNFIVSSSNVEALREFYRCTTDIHIGIILPKRYIRYASLTKEINAHSLHPSRKIISKQMIHRAHKEGMKVFVYTVNNISEIQYMKKIGVDGIFSDYPDRIRDQ